MCKISKSLLTIAFLCAFILPAFGQGHPFRILVMGEVVDRPYSNALTLIKENGDPRVSGIRIPIENGKFRQEFEADQQESYALIFTDELEKGAFRPIVFFAEPDTVRFTLYPGDRFAGNALAGGRLNQELVSFDRNIEEL